VATASGRDASLSRAPRVSTLTILFGTPERRVTMDSTVKFANSVELRHATWAWGRVSGVDARVDGTYAVLGLVGGEFGHHVDPVDATVIEHISAIVRAAQRRSGYRVPQTLDIERKDGVLGQSAQAPANSNRAYICSISTANDNVVRITVDAIVLYKPRQLVAPKRLDHSRVYLGLSLFFHPMFCEC
jgi:hypothetical protein